MKQANRLFTFSAIILALLLVEPAYANNISVDTTPTLTAGGAPGDALGSAGTNGGLLQFTSAGHVLGFGEDGVIVASARHMLRTDFLDARAVSPEADGEVSGGSSAGAVPPLGRVTYRNLWDGVTVVYEASGGAVAKSTYYIDVTEEGVRVDLIRLGYNRPVQIDEKGNLLIIYEDGTMVESAPVAWQETEGGRKPVTVTYDLRGEREVGFSLGDYAPGIPVVIDPVMTWNTFLGGSDTETVRGIAVDGSGNVYVSGTSNAWGSPVRGHYGSGNDAFAAKLDSSGSLTWHTFLGGSATDGGNGIAVDDSGNVYVVGRSDATWAEASPERAYTSGQDAFAAKLASNGSLTWYTFLGGIGHDPGKGIAVDGSGNVYVVGTSGADWTEASPARAYTSGDDAFAAKLTSLGALTWHTFLGGSATDAGQGIAVDGSGNVYVVGTSGVSSLTSWGLPVRDYFVGGDWDAFAAKLSSSGNLTWNTFLGGYGYDYGQGIAVDDSGNVYVGGRSSYTWGSPVWAYTSSGQDAFAAKLDSSGSLTWNTFLGDSGSDFGYAIAVDGSNVYVGGRSDATWGSPVRLHDGSGNDAFAAKFDANASVTFTDGSSYVPSVTMGTTNQAIGRFQLTGDISGANLTDAVIKLNGTRTGMSNVNLWSSTDNSFDSGSDTQLGSTVATDPGAGNSATFSSFTSAIATSGTYYFVTVDVASNATGVVQGVIVQNSSLTISSGSLSGTITNAALSSGDVSLNPQAYAQGAGWALDFDGDNDIVVVSGFSLSTNAITVEAWVKHETLPSAIQRYVTVAGGVACIRHAGDGKLQFYIKTSDTIKLLVVSDALTTGEWYHIVGTWDGTTQRLYKNGVEIASETPGGTLDSLSNVFFSNSGSETMDGFIDEVRIWNVGLDAATIRAWMCRKVTSSHTNYSNLKGYWKLDEGSGTTAADSSGNGNNGTLTNGPSWGTSGAAIGDASTYDYSTPTSVNLTHSDGDDITVSSISGSPDGVQIYRVDEAPNVTTVPSGSGWDRLDPLRYWGVFVIGGSSPTYTVTYNYDGHPGITAESDLALAYRSDNSGTSWTNLSAILNTTDNDLEKTSESAPKEYILGATTSDNSLPVELTSFTATAGDGKVTLNWITESEIENLGFNIYRGAKSNVKFLIINDELIPGAGNSSQRHEYEYVDNGLTNGVTYWYKLEDVDYSGNTELHGPVSATPMKKAAPKEFCLYPNYPNPFNPVTTISYDLPEDGFVDLSVYNMRGEKVATLMQCNQEAGSYRLNWDGTSQSGDMVASGIYFLRIASGNYCRTDKMIFIR